VRVLLERVDAVQKRLQFAILDEEQEGQGSALRAQGSAKAAKKATKKSDKSGKKKGGASSIPAFAANVARPAGKKIRGKRGKTSMQRQASRPGPFPKKAKKGKRRK
jgi:ribonuclease R